MHVAIFLSLRPIFLSPLLLRSAPLRVAGTFPSCLGVRGGVTTGTSHQLSSSQGHVGRPSPTLTIAILRRLHAQVLGPWEEVWGRWREPTQTQGDKKDPVLGMEPVVFIAP